MKKKKRDKETQQDQKDKCWGNETCRNKQWYKWNFLEIKYDNTETSVNPVKGRQADDNREKFVEEVSKKTFLEYEKPTLNTEKNKEDVSRNHPDKELELSCIDSRQDVNHVGWGVFYSFWPFFE